VLASDDEVEKFTLDKGEAWISRVSMMVEENASRNIGAL
jgi:hypothetical protein